MPLSRAEVRGSYGGRDAALWGFPASLVWMEPRDLAGRWADV